MACDRVYPLTFEPVFRDYIWGGRRLEALFGRELPSGIVAESWDISGHPSASTRVEAGRWKGFTLPELLSRLGTALVGTRSASLLARGRFPLMVKLLDAEANLSVQVHPDDRYATEHDIGDLGKVELWYVLHTQAGAELICGLAPGVTKETFVEAIETDHLEPQLHRMSIAAGDVVFIPAGTVHALLEGAVVAEIQQTSDATYRLHDWGRLGVDGRPRPLHIDKALDVIDWAQAAPGKVKGQVLYQDSSVRRSLLVACPQFTAERIEFAETGGFAGNCDGSTFEIWGSVKGGSEIHWTGETVRAEAICFALLPAALGAYEVWGEQGSTLLRVYMGEPE